MKPTAFLGIFFLAIGALIVFAMLATVIAPLLQTPPAAGVVITTTALALLAVGVALMVFGALLIPFSHADKALSQLSVTVTNLPFIPKFGGSRAEDKTATAQAAAAPRSTVVSVSSSEAPKPTAPASAPAPAVSEDP